MKLRLLLTLLLLTRAAANAADPVAGAPAPAEAAASASDSPAMLELKALVTQIYAKLKAGKGTAEDLADDIAAFEKLSTKYLGQKTEDAAQILYAHAIFYVEVLPDNDKALQRFRQVKQQFPDTDYDAAADKAIAMIEADIKAATTRAALIGKKAPELLFTWSSRSGLKKLSALKGKVVVLDFWATWCAPCVASFPEMRELTARYKDLDVVVLGVTTLQGAIVGLEPAPILTQNDPTKEYSVMKDYIKAKNITWPVAFATGELFNPDYGVYSIPYLGIIAPDGTVRHAGIDPRTPAAEKYAKIDAILKEFRKKLPPASPPGK